MICMWYNKCFCHCNIVNRHILDDAFKKCFIRVEYAASKTVVFFKKLATHKIPKLA